MQIHSNKVIIIIFDSAHLTAGMVELSGSLMESHNMFLARGMTQHMLSMSRALLKVSTLKKSFNKNVFRF